MRTIVLLALLIEMYAATAKAAASATGQVVASRRGVPLPGRWSPAGLQQSAASTEDEIVAFKLHFQQCNLDKLEETALQVSGPSHKRYGKYLTSKAVCDLVR